MSERPRVGVLSLQGDFARHREALEAIGAEACRVSLPGDLEGLGALILPGGESTTMLRLIEATGLRAPLERFVREQPVLGTCAGVILLSRQADRLPYPPFGALDIVTTRNGYGRQIDSFHAPIDAPLLGEALEGVFIRAPRITRVGAGVQVIARRAVGDDVAPEPVGVRSGRVVGLCFHPELTADRRVHRWFVREVAGLALPGGPAVPRARGNSGVSAS